jgi:hypothetical protein
MIKEKYEKPFMEVVELKDDVILTSGGSSPYCPTDCTTDASCFNYKYGRNYYCSFLSNPGYVDC